MELAQVCVLSLITVNIMNSSCLLKREKGGLYMDIQFTEKLQAHHYMLAQQGYSEYSTESVCISVRSLSPTSLMSLRPSW